jgi:cell division control protein 6
MSEVFEEWREEGFFINCMSFERAEEVFEKIVLELGGRGTTDGALEKVLLKRKGMWYAISRVVAKDSLVVLDEMDHLVTKNQRVMHKLVEYAHRPGSKLILIGIANSLNLTDKFLPRVKGKATALERLSFNPYTTEEIIQIITQRLGLLAPELSTVPLIDAKAIELCARKVSAATGDLRMALDMCRKAIELLETEHLRQQAPPALREIQTPSPSPVKRRRVTDVDLSSAPKVTPMHIMTVTKTLGSAHTFQARLKALPVHHKAILCAVVLLKSPQPTVGDVCDKYTKLCRRDGMLDPLPRGEFLDACEHLDSNDMISIEKKGRKTAVDRTRKVGLGIQEVDILQAISGMEMLTRFFDE